MTKARWVLRALRSFILVAVLALVQVRLVRHVQWVHRELAGLEDARNARRGAEAELSRAERELLAECRTDRIAARAAAELDMEVPTDGDLLFWESPQCGGGHGILPPCVFEAVDAVDVPLE